MWSPGLRQGDIVGPEFLPLMGKTFKTLADATSLSKIGEQEHKQVILGGRYDHLVVASHCCEFNEGKRTRFLVARLQSVPRNLSQEQVEGLRLSNDIVARTEEKKSIEGLDSFFFDALPGEFDRPMLASFQTLTPIPVSLAENLRRTKKAELDHDVRLKFRRKLAWFFGRDPEAEDIPESEKSPAPTTSDTSEEVAAREPGHADDAAPPDGAIKGD